MCTALNKCARPCVQELLSRLLATGSEQTKYGALQLLVNLCSDAVDPASGLTKRSLLEHGAGPTVLAFTRSAGGDGQVLACAALQNLVSTPEWARLVVSTGHMTTLEQLVESDESDEAVLVRYAAGTLKNVLVALRTAGDDYTASAATLEAISRRTRQATLEAFAYKRTTRLLAKAVRAMPSELRLRRMLASKDPNMAAEQERAVQVAKMRRTATSRALATHRVQLNTPLLHQHSPSSLLPPSRPSLSPSHPLTLSSPPHPSHPFPPPPPPPHPPLPR